MDYQQTCSNRAYLHSSEKETFLQLDLCLSADDKDVVKDPQDQRKIIFVVDCSGSMHGDSIREAKTALEVCLKAMQEGTTFNICRFGSKFEHLFRAPKTYTEKTLEKGVARAGRGASEFIYPGERIETKMLRLFVKTASQGITDFSVDWAGMKAEQAPAAPTLFLDTPRDPVCKT